MCGISGIISESISNNDQNLVHKATQTLRHRGPDFCKVKNGKNFTFGHSRLSIIDLSAGANQPMSDKEEAIQIVFNGEIYNYLELKKNLIDLGYGFETDSDTEVIIAGYKKWGIDFVTKLRGMFSIALWDEGKNKLFLFRDIFGERPLFYQHLNKTLKFSSEIKSLLAMCEDTKKINYEAVDLFLHYQFIPEPHSLIHGILKVPPAHYLEFCPTKGSINVQKYCDPFVIEPSEIVTDEKEYVSEIKKRLQIAVDRTLVADVPIAIALSGGIDSSAIAALAVNSGIKITAFSVGYPGSPPYDERKQACKLATELKIDIHEIEIPVEKFVSDLPNFIRILDEPIADPAAYAHYTVPQFAHKLGFKVILSGIGGDEFFWGYSWLSKTVQINLGRIKKNTGIIEKFKRKPKSNFITPNEFLYFYEGVEDFKSPFKHKNLIYGKNMQKIGKDNVFSLIGPKQLDARKIPTSIIKALCATWLSANSLALADRVGMANSVETRMPFLDYDLIRLVISNQEKFPSFSLNPKHYLKLSLKDVLKKEILHRPKAGFRPPVSEWLEGAINEYIQLLDNGFLIKKQIISITGLEYLKQEYKTRNWEIIFLLYKLVLIELWFREYLDPNS
jgi:asparagine synthase (glutamine-hydrolysing)